MARSHTGEASLWAQYCSGRWQTATPGLAALALGALFSTPGWATPPDAQFSAGAGGASPLQAPGAVSGLVIGDFPDAGGTDAAYTTTTLTAHANGAANSRGSASSQATIVYYGEVVGSPTSPVPLSIVGALSASWGGGGGPAISGGGADASMAWGIAEGFDLFGPGAGGADACAPAPCGSSSLTHVNAVFDVDVGQIFEVALEAQGSGTNGALYSVTADPQISILPDFLAANPGLSLEFSPNIAQPGSAGSVPEPSTWALLTLGFAALAFAMRRRAAPAGAVGI
jgi:PEP-CTERM motif